MTTKPFYLVTLPLLLIIGCKHSQHNYSKIEGFAQGTSYHITYENPRGKDYKNEIDALLREFEKSLSIYDTTSIISRINNNDPSVIADDWFVAVFNKSAEINKISEGAFDITVGPVVRAWGFSTAPFVKHDSAYIDSLLQFVGMGKVRLEERKVIKSLPGVQLDVNALAQGYSVDVVCEFFIREGIKNYMVEIGGEVRGKGKNSIGKYWRIGIDKPIDGNMQPGKQLEAVIEINDLAVATSGNYRKFFIENGVKYSHTIDPKTGKPSRNTLLSATVVAPDCITADALATTFMVLGVDKSILLLKKLPGIECLFMFSNPQGGYEIFCSKGMNPLIIELEK